MLSKKIDHIYNNNILIPKEGKDDEENQREEKNTKDVFVDNIQEEVRKLHYQIQSKDKVISELKSFIKKSKNGEDNDSNDDQDEL